MARQKDRAIVSVIDKAAQKYAKEAERTATLLFSDLRSGKIKSIKKIGDGLLPYRIDIYLVTGRRMKKNVLSFEPLEGFPRPDLAQEFSLGEIYLNPIFIRNQYENLPYMLIHGFLHLLGYDHGKKDDRIRMEKAEMRILKRHGLSR